jgi:hypothetical protein
MLIYNFKKEFIGIDEKDLKTLGFNDLANLKAEVSDFADLFVKTPGFIHNFKHVHWIDFITCADSNEESKVIINVNNKNFRCVLNIQTAYLIDHPSSKAYIVNLNNLRELTHKESDQIAGDIVDRPLVKAMPATFTAPEFSESFDGVKKPIPASVQVDPYETPIEIDFDEEDEFVEEPSGYDEKKTYDEIEEEVAVKEEKPKVDDMDSMLDVGDLSFDEDELITEEVPVQTQIVKENFDNGYIYDPHVASDELGLPLDLIEEFIQDFILQAKEFKDDLYKSLNNAELDNVKILSHKLKGVAANLRVEDAFETLSIINNSADVNVIRENMDTFYKIVAKLAGEEIEVEKTVTVEVHPEITPDEPLDIKIEETAEKKEVESLEDEDLEDDLYSIDDAEVPQKIEIPELADDDFLSNDLEIEEIDHELDNIEDIELLELDKELDSSEEDLEDLEFKEEPQAIEYSKKTAASEIGIDQESFNELLDDYLIEGQTITREMLTSLSDDDFAALKNEAMKLKGMSENMRITNFLPELKVIMSSNDTAEITKAIEKINAILAQISKIGE